MFMNKPRLTPFNRRYIEHRVQGLSPVESYKAAGGTSTNSVRISNLAWRLEKHPLIKEQIDKANEVAFERNVGSVEYIINECVAIVKEAREGGAKTLGPAVAALNLLSKRFPEFRDANIDARQVNLIIPEGTTIEDIRALRNKLLEQTDQ